MKTYIQEILLTFGSILLVHNVCAEIDSGNFDVYLNNAISSQVEDVVRYGDTQTSLFTGRLDFSVPIYSLDDPDFHLDIALQYNSDAFKPLKHSGWVGYNWHMQTGGCITREVRNYADEASRKISDGTHFRYSKGMYLFATETNYNKEDIYVQDPNCFSSCSNPPTLNVGNNCTYDVDYMPDIFHYNFFGYNGTFMINNAGEVRIISGDYVDVDLSQIIDIQQMPKSCRPKPLETSQITIKTNDGYTYIFGGRISALEYTYALENRNTDAEQVPPTITSWYLTKVIAPNRRTMEYHYKKGNVLDEDYPEEWPIQNERLYEFNLYFDMFAPKKPIVFTFTSYNNLTQLLTSLFEQQLTDNLKYNLMKTCVLDSICISGDNPMLIKFHNSSWRQSLYKVDVIGGSRNNYMLDSIEVFSGERIIKRAAFEFLTKSSGDNPNFSNNWHFLSAVHISGVGRYTFDYDTNLYPFPSLNLDIDSEYFNLVDLNGYWKQYSKKGLLTDVHFPTGGRQHFIYGCHYYNIERRHRRLQNGGVELYSKTTGGLPLAGARIEQINTYDSGNNLVEKRIFNYVIPGANSVSSGVYYNNWLIYSSDDNTCVFLPQSNNYSFFDNFIGYSDVEEIVKDNNSVVMHKNIYSFDTGMEYFSSDSSSINNQNVGGFEHSVFSGLLTYDENLYAKGKLILKKYFDNENQVVKTNKYRYNGVSIDTSQLGSIDTIVVFSHFWDNRICRKIYLFPDVLTKDSIFYYYEGECIATTKTYSYDSKLRVKEEIEEDSRGVKHFAKYTYPDEVPGSDQLNGYPTPLFILCHSTANRIGDPVETISGYIENNTEYITEGKIKIYGMNTYSEGNSLFFVPYLNKTMSLSLSSPITTYTYMSALNSQLTYDERYRLDCEYYYDTMLRPLSVKPYGGVETRYTWNGIYPSSKTLGNQTWIYTFIPHVGVNSITDPRGITTYYDYDSFGRLIKEYQVIDDKEQILNVYQYHIKTE